MSPGPSATEVLAAVRERPATLGSARLLGIDGPSGSGKTTLAAAVVALAPEARLVHLDDLYEGWSGLPAVGGQLEALLRPLSRGEPGRYRRYDWVRGSLAESVVVPPAPLVVVEGVGAGALTVADLTTLLVWLDAPLDVRRERGLARDGAAYAPHWDAWAAAEADHFALHRTRERADVVLTT